ncbi:MAG: adenosylmethionine decarboxylase [Bacillota bacterium]|nr:MAG: S-adenosylmethionine decarboxylase proenzyme [Bacillota bacterium]
MKALGRHILAEVYGCDPTVINDVEKVERILVDAALKAGAEIREVAFHKFSPQGVSGMVIISESHLAVHTWPELGYAAVDVFTCGEHVDPWVSMRYICEAFGAQNVTATETLRGIMPEKNSVSNQSGRPWQQGSVPAQAVAG